MVGIAGLIYCAALEVPVLISRMILTPKTDNFPKCDVAVACFENQTLLAIEINFSQGKYSNKKTNE